MKTVAITSLAVKRKDPNTKNDDLLVQLIKSAEDIKLGRIKKLL